MPRSDPQLFLYAAMQIDMKMCWLWLCSKFKPNLNQSKSYEVAEKSLPMFIPL